MLGCESQEVIGKEVHSLIHHSHEDGTPYDEADCPMRWSFKEGKSSIVDDEILWRQDGTFFYVEYYSTPLIVEHEIKGAVLLFKDTTERKKIEQELRHTQYAIDNAGDAIFGIRPMIGQSPW